MDAIEAFARIQESAAAHRKADPRRIASIQIDEAVRQGDIYIKRIARLPAGVRPVHGESQLAPGVSRGSRHIITAETLSTCSLYRLAFPTPLQGPFIVARESFEVGHPEHGHFILPPGVYAVTYQRRHAEEVRRVAD